MKATIVTASISREAGGLYFAVSRLTRGLCDQGMDMLIHGLRDQFSDEDLPAWQPAMCAVHDRIGPSALGYSPSLAKALISGNSDLIHTHGIWQWPSAAVHRWHRRTGRPYLVSPHGMLDPWALANSQWKKRVASLWYESAHLRDAACIHALCQSEADSIRAYGLKNPICIIPNGVELVKAETLKTETLKLEKKILLFLGRLHPKKGLVNALRAWAEIRGQGSGVRGQEEWQFVVAGWDQGGHEAELKCLCDELGLAWADVPAAEFVEPLRGVPDPSSLVEHDDEPCSSQASLFRSTINNQQSTIVNLPPVVFLGPAFGEAKDQLLRRAHAFILPSFSEGLPMSVLEAWAYQLPVLMTDACNLPEGFAADAAIRIGTGIRGQESGDRGQKSGDRAQPLGIDEGMRALIEMTDAERIVMGQRGRALVEQHFTWPQVAAQMKEVYEWLLGGGTKPDCVVSGSSGS